MRFLLPALAIPCLLAVDLDIDCGAQRQVIHGFGTCQAHGGDPAKKPLADWMVNRTEDVARMYVQDLRLAVYRTPLSPWVLEGENPYKMPVTVTEEMKADPTKIVYQKFTWDPQGRDRGALPKTIAWLKLLTRLDPEIMIIASVWSPPSWMKRPAKSGAGKQLEWSKFGCNTCGGELDPRYYTHFAHYLAAWSKALKELHGVNLAAVSIQNELSFFEPYDSCVYTPKQFAAVVKEVGRVFAEQGITTRIIGPEDMTKFPERQMSFVAETMKDPAAAKALAAVCSHGYADGLEITLTSDDAGTLWGMMQKTCPGKEYWMTETGAGTATWAPFTLPEDSKSRNKGTTKPGAMTMFGAMLHNALVAGNASLWTSWQFLDEEPGWGSGLVQVAPDKLVWTKKASIQKHYSYFIPRGSHRVEITPAASADLLASAYLSKDGKGLAVVIQNHAEGEQVVNLKLQKAPAGLARLLVSTTDAQRDCTPTGEIPVQDQRCQLRLAGRTMVTLHTPMP